MRFFNTIKPSHVCLMTVHMWIYCTPHRPIDTGGVSIMTVMYIFLSAFLILLALKVYRSPVSQVQKNVADGASMLFMAVSALFLTMPLPFTGAETTIIGSALGGIGVAWLYMCWGEFYSELEIRYAAPLIFLTMALGSCGKTIIDLLPTLPATVILMTLPLVSFACVRRAQHSTPEAIEPDRYYNSRTVRSLWRLVLGIVVYSFVVGLIQSMPLDMPPSAYEPMVLAHHGGEVLIALAFFVWIVFLKRGLNFSRTWRVVLLLMATALLFAANLGHLIGGYFYVLMGIAQTALIILLFLALADIARHSSYNPLLIFSVGWIAYALPFPLGDMVGSLFHHAASNASLVMSFIVWILVIVTLFFLDESSVGKQPIFPELNEGEDDDTPAKRIGEIHHSLDNQESTDTLSLRCAVLSDELQLTPREREVLELLVRGRSKIYIAEAFFVSENTIRGHVKRLYAKVGVHNKQELVDCVESVNI